MYAYFLSLITAFALGACSNSVVMRTTAGGALVDLDFCLIWFLSGLVGFLVLQNNAVTVPAASSAAPASRSQESESVIRHGVQTWTMYGIACGIVGCVCLEMGNKGGWAGIIAGLAAWVNAAALQFFGNYKSGLKA